MRDTTAANTAASLWGSLWRCRRVLALSAILALIAGSSVGAGSRFWPALQAQRAQVKASAVVRTGFTVTSLARSIEFFTRVLEFRVISIDEANETNPNDPENRSSTRVRRAVLGLGEEQLELSEFSDIQGRRFPRDSRSNDRWFQHIAIVVSDLSKAHEKLLANRVESASSGPQRLPDWNPNAGGIEAFYFRDPDGHYLELIRFPKGKGDARWIEPSGKLFLGIDHTAIVVADTDTSLKFYRDTLGFRIAGQSLNYGPEQERLNNVDGARLRITGLRAEKGPGIELLEYLNPRDGRPIPGDFRRTDIAYWRTMITTEVQPNDPYSRDPDGHWLFFAAN